MMEKAFLHILFVKGANYIEREWTKMDNHKGDNRYAKLDPIKIKELKELEKKFGYTLVAFNTSNNQDTKP